MTARKYFKTLEAAEKVDKSLPEFAPSKYLSKREIDEGLGKVRVKEFDKGFAVQLGACGSYYPATTADHPTTTR